MKKTLMLLLLISLLLASVFPIQSIAEEAPAPGTSENRNYYSKSDHTYDEVILEAMMTGTPVKRIFGQYTQYLLDLTDDKYGLTIDNHGDIRFFLEYTRPELIGFLTLFREYSQSTGATKAYYAWFTENSVAEREAFQTRAPQVMEEINALIPAGADTFQKVHIVHDYLVSCTAYDYENYDNANVGLLGYNFDAYGVFVKHLSMCEGYSLAFKYVMQQLGIPCAVVTSPTAQHAWNVVQIDGEWYHVDLSADDGLSYDMLGHVSHKYLCISTETLLSLSSNRSDFRVYFDSADPVFSDETCATSKKYETGQVWNGCESCCHYVENEDGGIDLYTIDGESHYLMKNGDYYYLPNEDTTWRPNGISGATYTVHHGRLAGDGATLYMTTPRSIYKIDTTTDEKTVVYQVSRSKGSGSQIFGLAFVENELYCIVDTDTPKTNATWLRVADYVPEKSGAFGIYGNSAWIIDSDRVLNFSGNGLESDLTYHCVFASSYDENGQMIDCQRINAVTDTMYLSKNAAICQLSIVYTYGGAYSPVRDTLVKKTVIDLTA